MKLFYIAVFSFFLIAVNGTAQTLRINLYAGASNYYGDIQTKKLTLNQAHGAVGAGATINLTNNWLLRGDYFFTKVGADDKKGAFTSRNLNFKTFIQELNLLAEYNLWNPDENKLAPYIFAGLGVFRFSPYTTDSAHRKIYLSQLSTEGQGLPQYPNRKMYRKVQLNVPVGGGVKFTLSDDVQFGLEYGLRFMFTDYLDDVSTTYVDRAVLLNAKGRTAVALAFRGDELTENSSSYPPDQTLRGSNQWNDIYYYGVARLSIRMKWFDNLGGGMRNKLGCPANVL